MNYPIKGGYRISQLERCTVAMLSHKTWAELRRPDPFLNGNTKFQEMPIVAFYFRNGFVDATAAIDIGYYVSNVGTVGNSLAFRLNRTNTQSLLSFGTKLMISGLLKKDWAWLLDPKRTRGKITGKGGGGRISKNRAIFSKAIVDQAITKYGMDKAPMKLKVDKEIIRFWQDYKV